MAEINAPAGFVAGIRVEKEAVVRVSADGTENFVTGDWLQSNWTSFARGVEQFVAADLSCDFSNT